MATWYNHIDQSADRDRTPQEKILISEFQFLRDVLEEQAISYKIYMTYQKWCWCGGKAKQPQVVFEVWDSDLMLDIVETENIKIALEEYWPSYSKYNRKKIQSYRVDNTNRIIKRQYPNSFLLLKLK